MATRAAKLAGWALPLATLAGCGGAESSGGSVASTPTPPPVSVTSSATPTPVATPTVNYDTAEYRRSNASAQAQAIAAYNAGATGTGVVVGVIDSGVDTNSAEFTGRISPRSADFAGARGIQDEGGHGTAVSDVLLGARNDNGVHGIAFNATLLALRTDTPGSCASASSDTDGCSHTDNNIAAALDAATSARARVVNDTFNTSATVNGLEIELAARPIRALTFTASYGYQDATYDNYPDAPIPSFLVPIPAGRATLTTNLTGQTLPFVPRHSVVLTAEYDRPISDALAINLGTDFQLRSKYNVTDGIDQIRIVSDTTQLGVHVGVGDADGKWRLTGRVYNLTNQVYRTSLDYNSFVGTVYQTLSAPRTFAIEGRVKF